MEDFVSLLSSIQRQYLSLTGERKAKLDECQELDSQIQSESELAGLLLNRFHDIDSKYRKEQVVLEEEKLKFELAKLENESLSQEYNNIKSQIDELTRTEMDKSEAFLKQLELFTECCDEPFLENEEKDETRLNLLSTQLNSMESELQDLEVQWMEAAEYRSTINMLQKLQIEFAGKDKELASFKQKVESAQAEREQANRDYNAIQNHVKNWEELMTKSVQLSKRVDEMEMLVEKTAEEGRSLEETLKEAENELCILNEKIEKVVKKRQELHHETLRKWKDDDVEAIDETENPKDVSQKD
eukprot:MONOS_10640.1-p1 / transcript=MONOS_10640.1 / gene=MONOS_10640 / organism=Monocercomonoides_exilis_PA203 / gene_product=unspecified product / transcript_product=unspecified product / location=Mono_scaffold00492:411-1473(-) / protein_length=299 / sequence_SO=supercontig / SO=protein_coding / is_pseudo=false